MNNNVVFTNPNDIEEYKSICNGTHPDTLESQKRKELAEKWTEEHCKFTHTYDRIIIECDEINEDDII